MSTIKSSAEHLTLNADGSGNDIKFQSNGSEVASISDGGVVTATSFAGSGANLTGISSVGGATGVDFNDNTKARFGTGNDLEIYHDASDSYIKDVGTGNFLIQSSDLYFGDASGNHKVVFRNGTGRVGIGNTNPAYELEIGNTSTKGWSVSLENNVCNLRFRASADDTQTHAYFMNTNGVVGKITTLNSGTSFLTSSDYRLKENVNYTWDATTRLKQLKPCRFNFIADDSVTVDGFIAHEVTSIVPEAISGEKDAMTTDENGDAVIDPQGIDQSKLVPLLVKTIQELEARITALEA